MDVCEVDGVVQVKGKMVECFSRREVVSVVASRGTKLGKAFKVYHVICLFYVSSGSQDAGDHMCQGVDTCDASMPGCLHQLRLL